MTGARNHRQIHDRFTDFTNAVIDTAGAGHHHVELPFVGAGDQADDALLLGDLSAIQDTVGDQDFWGLKPCLIGDDVGAVRVR